MKKYTHTEDGISNQRKADDEGHSLYPQPTPQSRMRYGGRCLLTAD